MAIVLRHATPDTLDTPDTPDTLDTLDSKDAPDTKEGVRCSLCGCDSVNLDYWDDPDGEASMQLGQCPRCDHRWTSPLAVLQPPALLSSPASSPAFYPAFYESSVSSESPPSSEFSGGCPGLPAAA